MTLEQQVQRVQHVRMQAERMTRQHWLSPEDRQAALRTMKAQLAAPEGTLNLPIPSDKAYARGRLLTETILLRDVVTSLEFQYGPHQGLRGCIGP
jgi:hypothetical protein